VPAVSAGIAAIFSAMTYFADFLIEQEADGDGKTKI
jgi:hypothetical protein